MITNEKQPSGLDEEAATVTGEHLRLLMQPDALAFLEQAHNANSDWTSAASGQESRSKMFAVLPHGTDALDSYPSAFWSLSRDRGQKKNT